MKLNFDILFDWASKYGYLGLFAGLVLEGMGIPLPSEVFYAAAGLLVGTGDMNFWIALSVAVFANTLGNYIGYSIGRSASKVTLTTVGPKMGASPKALHKAERWFQRHGPIVVLLSRWIGPIRAATILLAGITRLDVRVFLVYSFLGSLTWGGVWMYVFYLLGPRWRQVMGAAERLSSEFWVLTLVLLVGAILVGWIVMVLDRRRRHRR